ncbi:RNA polymerase, N/8 Kd subunit [Pyrolobus fumarii 1A]|uniref:DNA-directed RNA polymerase subunit Rpo10 n=1 Tax=Pyrolobus fumarii (strain DSM 11204 / 1A) TaxID=694429 RepID=G0EF24_PYRF1|nr:DNA-directed RNA polymerase subunit N [Pyrolobus fumarii]AEM38921.1 RNA polymerase, N/8 Kd subunit [Pyrolobus fumarii 1A]
MIIPVRCWTCGAPLAQYWEEFHKRVQNGEDPKKVLDELGIKRYCCRRMLLAHVPLIYEVIRFRRFV